MTFIDSHCHIDGPDFDVDREHVIARARAAGVTTMLNVGTGDPHSGAFERAVQLAENHDDVYVAVGVHPHDAKLFDDAAEKLLLDLIEQSKRVIAWGEIGLDYHYDHSPREVQREVFRRQHLGFYISFAGNLTFKNAQDLREIARQLPLDRLLVETDCPYLTPVPFRGKRNEPARVVETARCLAELHGRELVETGRFTSENFARLFEV